MCHARKAQATWVFSAWEHCPAAKAARAGYQNFVPGCSRLLCHQLYQHRHRPQTGSARNKRKKTCTGMHQHEKKTARTSTSCLSVHANKDAKTYQRAVHSSLVAVAVRKLFKSLRYTNIGGWRNPHHFNNSISRSTNLNLHTAGGGFDWISFSAILEVPFQPLWEASFGATHSVSHSWNIPESLKQNENWLGPVLGHRCYCTLKQLVRVTKSHDDQSWCQILEISHTRPPI